MGLAATQARFLALTSRKANCEYRSMELAQQKLSLSRELEEATINYNNSVNATKIIWDADGSGEYRYNLSYDLMMTPSDLNKYMPYMLSRQDGKIAVDEKMQKALAGIISDDGGLIYNGQTYYLGDAGYEEAKMNTFQQFIENLKANKIMPSSYANNMKTVAGANDPYYSEATPYYMYIEDAGIGGEMSGRETANMMTVNSMLSWIDNIVANVSTGYYSSDSKEYKLAESFVIDFDGMDYIDNASEQNKYGQNLGEKRKGKTSELIADGVTSCFLKSGWNSAGGSTTLLYNGNYWNNGNTDYGGLRSSSLHTSNIAFTLADLLDEDVTLLVTGKQNYNAVLENISNTIKSGDTSGFYDLINLKADEWYDAIAGKGNYKKLQDAANSANVGNAASSLAIINFIDKIAKGMYNLLMPENPEPKDLNAFYVALDALINSFRNSEAAGSEQSYADLGGKNKNSEAKAKEAVAGAEKYNCWVKCGNEWAISLSNLTEAFLTNFVNGMDLYQDNCMIAKKVGASTYITDDPSYLFTVNTTDDSETGLWESEFYSAIFNNICANGWYENQMMNDKGYLDNALKNGQLFVVSKAKDNFYYQTRYVQSSGGHIMEETDEEAVAQAERDYTYIKNRINYKEERIEVETKSIDAELLSLNTEYETVKNLISKNIDKTFKLFQS